MSEPAVEAGPGDGPGGPNSGSARRASLNHAVKSWPELFEATRLGLKTHDLRRVAERDYRAGDTLTLREFDPVNHGYTGRELQVRITYVTSARLPCALSGGGLDPDYCILSVTRV